MTVDIFKKQKKKKRILIPTKLNTNPINAIPHESTQLTRSWKILRRARCKLEDSYVQRNEKQSTSNMYVAQIVNVKCQ